jgi:alcohol dehydrogenase (NADP+)
MVGMPDEALPQLSAGAFAGNAAKLTGSHLGNHQEMEDMLRLAAEKGVKPWVETLKLSEQGCKEAVERVKDNKVHYRFTMTDFDKAFGSRK